MDLYPSVSCSVCNMMTWHEDMGAYRISVSDNVNVMSHISKYGAGYFIGRFVICTCYGVSIFRTNQCKSLQKFVVISQFRFILRTKIDLS